jgi:ABC-2 type transport system permease protein
MMDITNWRELLRFAIRRDRWYLVAWVVGIAALGTLFVPVFPSLAGSNAEISVLSEMMENPAMVALCGAKYGDAYTLAIMYTQMMLIWVALTVAVFNIFLVIRHTRADEEAGRLEVVGSLPVGRSANLASVAVLALAANLVIGILVGFGQAAFGVETIDLAGSLTIGAALSACGLVFAALALVIVQVTQASRGATGTAMALLGLAYLVRAGGDVSAPAAALASPLGIIEKTEPFYANRLWPIGLLLGISLVLAAVAFALGRVRDLGLGMLPQRAGHAHAPRSLSGEWGLSWRILRGTLIAWAIAVFVCAAAYGSIMGDMQTFVESSDVYQQVLGVHPGDADLAGPVTATLLLIMAIIGAIPVIIAVNKLASEEKKSRLDPILGAAVSRGRLFCGYALIAGITGVVMMVLSGLGFGLVAQVVMDNPIPLSTVLKAAANYTPALLFTAGLGLAIVGFAKRLTALNWLYLVASFFMVYLGGIVSMPRAAIRATPFGLLQRWPLEQFSLWPDAVLVVLAIVLTGLGLAAYQRRDITA